jgi:hypothetical protein
LTVVDAVPLAAFADDEADVVVEGARVVVPVVVVGAVAPLVAVVDGLVAACCAVVGAAATTSATGVSGAVAGSPDVEDANAYVSPPVVARLRPSAATLDLRDGCDRRRGRVRSVDGEWFALAPLRSASRATRAALAAFVSKVTDAVASAAVSDHGCVGGSRG